LAELSLHANADQGFRAPNLDDLTSRQQVGPGFQFENAELRPERTTTFELGVSADIAWLKFEVWGFATLLDDGMFRAVREAADCPPETPACTASRNQVQLVNADETSFILGTEGGVTVYLPAELTLRAVYSYAFGEGPNTGSRNVAGRRSFDDRVPLSRIPPLNGSVEGRWLHRNTGIYAGAAVRWALRQDRLAPADINDARIPVGGTPGYATLDLRAGWRWSENFRINLVFENVFDAAYRVHGSSINGRGRGVAIGMMAAL
ncbi:MAG: TonB-dependent receptor, partial [Myxococcota bacterium]